MAFFEDSRSLRDASCCSVDVVNGAAGRRVYGFSWTLVTATGADRTVVDVTFQGEAATQPVISQLSRTYNIDISILGAAIDTVGGLQVGRMRIELPGRYEDNVVPIGFLREQGLQIDVVGQEPVLLKEAVK